MLYGYNYTNQVYIMSEILSNLKETEIKVLQLAKKIKMLREENAALKERNKSLYLQIDKQQTLIDNQNKTISNLKTTLASGLPPNTEWKEGLTMEIERYIDDIDKCLLWLRNS